MSMSICRRGALCVLFVLSPLVAHADVVLDWNARILLPSLANRHEVVLQSVAP
jgi:hypothetical protein